MNNKNLLLLNFFSYYKPVLGNSSKISNKILLKKLVYLIFGFIIFKKKYISISFGFVFLPSKNFYFTLVKGSKGHKVGKFLYNFRYYKFFFYFKFLKDSFLFLNNDYFTYFNYLRFFFSSLGSNSFELRKIRFLTYLNILFL